MDTVAAFLIALGVLSAANLEPNPRPETVAETAGRTAHRSEAMQQWLEHHAAIERRRIRLTNDWLRGMRGTRIAVTTRQHPRS